MEKFIEKTKYVIVSTLIFLLPFFFLDLTQEYFVTNKFYLLGFGSLFLILISGVELLLTKKIIWKKNHLDSLVLLFLTSVALSTLLSSPNKIQALLNPNFGLVILIFLTILYLYISRQKGPSSSNEVGPYIIGILSFSSFILSLITIIFYFQPFKNISLPQNLIFLKNTAFTPVGSQLDLAILLGFFVVLGLTQIFKKGRPQGIAPTKYLILNTCYLILNMLALFLTVYSLVKMNASILFPPFRLAWFSAIEILKNPKTAIIGIGPDNFSTVFTLVKDFAYNQSPLWQVDSFNVSRSAILQIFTETGIFGLLTFGLLIFSVVKQLIMGDRKGSLQIICLFSYVIICLFIFPPSLIVWFLFFIVIAQISSDSIRLNPISSDQSNIFLIYGAVVISLGLIGASGYFLGRSYASEYYFKKSADGITNNSLKDVYNNQRQAIILNPYIERFRSNFAQTNLLIANNLSSKVKNNLTEQERQTITQAIQAGISEAKSAVTLNPQKAVNWQNLASIYLNIINVAQGADSWTISAYQRAILADPQNPGYRVSLGGVYYSQKKYDDALKFFEQAVALKPDWSNANYNYAWANFQKKNYSQAVNAMQNTLNLINPKTNKADYEKAKRELEEFKKMLPI